jgi:hypothetical protein
MSEIENRLTGEKATIMRDRANHRTLIMKSASVPKIVYDPTKNRTIAKTESAAASEIPTPPIEKPKAEKKKKPKAEDAKTEKVEKEVKPAKPALKEIEQKVLDFLKTLDHPATSNEVRDHFNFSLRAPARAMFRKFEKLGFGENRKTNNKYHFFVKDKVYPPPKVEPPKVKPPKVGETKEK